MLNLTDLNECFNQAKEVGARYIAVKIAIGLNSDEVIVNPSQNFVLKQSYYNFAYDDNLRHKFAGEDDIRITGYAYGDTFKEIESKLEDSVLIGFN